MCTSIELLDRVKTAHNLPSDYAAAKLIGCTRSFISNIRLNKNNFGVDNALTIADLLGLEPLQLIACTRVEHWKRKGDKVAQHRWAKCLKKTVDKLGKVTA